MIDFLAYVSTNTFVWVIILLGAIAANVYLFFSIIIKQKVFYVRKGYSAAAFLISILSLLVSITVFVSVTIMRDRLFFNTAEIVMGAPKQTQTIAAPRPTGKLIVNSPADGSRVSERTHVEGHVKDSKAVVRVIVHPVDQSAYWVQPEPTVRANGSWRVVAYFGRPDQDHGKKFEIMAIANPNNKLEEGTVLSKWPKGELASDVIVVTRK